MRKSEAMHLNAQDKMLLTLALEKEIERCEFFYRRVEAGEFPGYGEWALAYGKELNEARRELLARLKEA